MRDVTFISLNKAFLPWSYHSPRVPLHREVICTLVSNAGVPTVFIVRDHPEEGP